MLERASVCLDTGVRASVRTQKRASRSKRLLHSTFWHHGSSELTLPPWAVHTQTAESSKITRRRDGDHIRAARDTHQQSSEPLFLDFLYPPQTRPLLSRLLLNSSEHADSRSACPVGSRGYATNAPNEDGEEGGMSALRKLRAAAEAQKKAKTKAPTPKKTKEKDQVASGHNEVIDRASEESTGSATNAQDEDGEQGGVSALRKLRAAAEAQAPASKRNKKRKQTAPKSGEIEPKPDAIEQDVMGSEVMSRTENAALPVETAPAESGVPAADGPTTEAATANAISPIVPLTLSSPAPDPEKSPRAELPQDLDDAALPEKGAQDTANAYQDTEDQLDPLPRLERNMANRRDGSVPSSREVWANYNAVRRQSSRRDHVLERTVLFWFSQQHNSFAIEKAIELFAQLDEGDRTSQSVHAAVTAYVLQGSVRQAQELHTTASQLRGSGPIGSQELMAHFFMQGSWNAVLQTYREYKAYCKLLPYDVVKPWLCHGLSRHDNFYQQIQSLVSYLFINLARSQEAQSKKSDYQEILESVCDEYIHGMRVLDDRGVAVRRRDSIRRLFGKIQSCGLGTATLYERCLSQLATYKRRADQISMSGSLNTLYRSYRKSAVFNPSKPLLHRLLLSWQDRLFHYVDQNELSYIQLHTLEADWIRTHGNLDDGALFAIMETYAHLGQTSDVRRYAAKYKSLHERDRVDATRLFPLIFVHMINRDGKAALDELVNIKANYGVEPDIRCWNITLRAFERGNDLEGALDVFKRFQRTGLEPTQHTFATLLTSCGKQGDIQGATEVIELARAAHVPINTMMMNGFLLAQANADELSDANKTLEEIESSVREGRMHGPLGLCFNTMMTTYALRKDLDMVRDLYRHMKEEELDLDGNTYSSLILALCERNRSDLAQKILTEVMAERRIRASALHYAVIMAGFVNEGRCEDALRLHERMQQTSVRGSISTRLVYLKARAILEHRRTGRSGTEGVDEDELRTTVQELVGFLDDNHPVRFGEHPEPGLRHARAGDVTSMYFGFLVFIHGQRRCFAAVQELYLLYEEKTAGQLTGENSPPLRLLTALMSVQLRAGNHRDVARYWYLARSKALRLGKLGELSRKVLALPNTTTATENDQTNPAPTLVEAEDGTPPTTLTTDNDPTSPPPSPTEAEDGTPIPQSLADIEPSKPYPVHRYILSRPLRYYITSLLRLTPPDTDKMTSTISHLLHKGYLLSTHTWNVYIEALCSASPPRVLLAFTLAERFLMPDWTGWQYPRRVLSNEEVRPKPAARRQGTQYMDPALRYRPRAPPVPQYRAMVYLAGALLELQRIETMGTSALRRSISARYQSDPSYGQGEEEVKRRRMNEEEEFYQIGTMRLIEERAPKTLRGVQDMPTVYDEMQQRIIRGRE